MNGFLIQILLVVLAVLVLAGLLLWSAVTIRYHVTARHLKVTWLGVPVRRVPLEDIKHISNRPVFWAERWPNTLFDNRRMLVIRRRHGWFRNFVITPKYPFEFKASLMQARQTLVGPVAMGGLGDTPLPAIGQKNAPPDAPGSSRAKSAA